MPALLFDANISYKIKYLLREDFPGSFHISDFYKTAIADHYIWEIAKEKGLIVVSYDEDFFDLQALKGFPPKVIWLRFGNQPIVYIANKLLINKDQISQLAESSELGILEIY
ncbi:MAG TPA: DUF5615 family PIN-like protein [Chitinophagales bacterium]|nr:DUF5615 family PIN-like protein [Chitinophagales bacterium]